MAEELCEIRMKVVWENKRAIRALRCITEVMEDIAEDFEYRGDVKKAIRAARYLTRNVAVLADDSEVVELMERMP